MNRDKNISVFPSTVGIYLDEEYISASVLVNNFPFEALSAIPAKIQFCSSEIKVGTTAVAEEFPVFSLYNLIKAPSEQHEVKLLGPNNTLTTEDIITSFFLEIATKIRKNGKIDTIGATTLAVPIWLSRLEKERLKFAMGKAGFNPLRIIPSSLAAAMLYASKTSLQSSQIIVIHSSYNTFSIAGIKISRNGIEPIETIRPEINESDEFWSIQSRLFNNKEQDMDKINSNIREYKQCLGRLQQTYSKWFCLLQSEKEPTQLETLISSILQSQGVQLKYLYHRQLVQSTNLGNRPKMYLRGTTEVNIQIDQENNLGTCFSSNHSSNFIGPGKILEIDIVISCNSETTLTISEVFQNNRYPVGQYKVNVHGRKPKGQVQINCHADEDGILAVTVPKGHMLRQYGFGTLQSSLEKLLAYYDSIKQKELAIEQAKVWKETIEIMIQQHFENTFSVGLAHYRKKMKEITDRAVPIKDKDIAHFHETLRQEILCKFDKTFEHPAIPMLSSANPNCEKYHKDARGKLESGTNTLLSVYTKRYAVQMQRHTSKIEECMLEMDEAYDQSMEKFINEHSASHDRSQNHQDSLFESTKQVDRVEENRLKLKEGMPEMKEVRDNHPIETHIKRSLEPEDEQKSHHYQSVVDKDEFRSHIGERGLKCKEGTLKLEKVREDQTVVAQLKQQSLILQDDLNSHHDQLVKELMGKFNGHLEEKGLKLEDGMLEDLQNRLNERSQQYGLKQQPQELTSL